MNEQLAISFSGWIRNSVRGRWRLYCRAATEKAVLDIHMREAPRGSDKLIRQGDAHPNDQLATVGRRRF